MNAKKWRNGERIFRVYNPTTTRPRNNLPFHLAERRKFGLFGTLWGETGRGKPSR